MYQAYNPYYYQTAARAVTRGNFLTRLLGGNINFSTLLNNTQKTLNVVNQAIPIYYQVKPLVTNAKTLFRIAGAIKDEEKKEVVNKSTESKSIPTSNQPIFYL